jgi:hypothetical protein
MIKGLNPNPMDFAHCNRNPFLLVFTQDNTQNENKRKVLVIFTNDKML